jgi:hypothetical protein
VHFVAADEDAAGREIDAQVAGGEDRLGFSPRAGGVAQRHPQPRQQLFGAERLGEIVIGPGVERGDLILLLAARRDDDDRRRRPFANAAGEVEAVAIRSPRSSRMTSGVRLVAWARPSRAVGASTKR